MHFHLKIPKPVRRHARYVSSGTKSAGIVVTPKGGSAFPAVIANCIDYVCTAFVPAPVGDDTFAVTLYAGTNGSGAILSRGSTSQAIVAGAANKVQVTVDGVIAGVALSLPNTLISPSFTSSQTLTVTAKDADAYTIVGKYFQKITLADSDNSYNTSLTTTSVTDSATVVTFKYSGYGCPNATISATVAGVSGITPVDVTCQYGVSGSTNVTWTSIGPVEPQPGISFWNPSNGGNSGKLNVVAVDPNKPGTMYVAGGIGHDWEVVTQAGIYKSIDGGNSWNAIDSGLTDTIVNDLWIDPANSAILVAATEHDGLFRSTDGGASWTQVDGPLTTRALLLAGSTLYAGTATGIAQSTDEGATWSTALTTTALVNALGAAGSNVYAGAVDGTSYENFNGTWTAGGTIPELSGQTGGFHSIAVDPATPSTAYADRNSSVVPCGNCQGSTIYSQDLWVTTNSGQTWAQVTLPSFLTGAQVIAFSLVTPHLLYVGGDTDAGAYDGTNWTQAFGDGYDAFGDSRALHVLPNGSGGEYVVAASDQGAYTAQSFTGAGLTSLTGGLSNNVVNDLAVNGSQVATTLQDFPWAATANGGSLWKFPGGTSSYEDGGVAIGEGTYSNVCLMIDYYYYAYSASGCESATVAAQKGGPNAGLSIIDDPMTPTKLYVIGGNGAVSVSTNGGQSLTATGWSLPAIYYLTIDPENDANMFAVSGSSLYATHDDGATWKLIDLGKYVYVEVVAVDPHNSNTVVLGCWDYYGSDIYRSSDGGKTFALVARPFGSHLRTRRNDYRRMFASLRRGNPLPRRYNSAITYFPLPYDLEFNPDPPAAQTAGLVMVTSSGAAVSFDDGSTWSTIRGNAISNTLSRGVWSGGNVYLATRGQGVLTASLQSPGPAFRKAHAARPETAFGRIVKLTP